MNETNTSVQKDEFSEILGSHFNLDSMVRETGNLFCSLFFDIFSFLKYIVFILYIVLVESFAWAQHFFKSQFLCFGFFV